jgi:hypothetical protein
MTDLCWLVAQVVAERCPIHRNAPIDQPWEIAATPFKAVGNRPGCTVSPHRSSHNSTPALVQW